MTVHFSDLELFKFKQTSGSVKYKPGCNGPPLGLLINQKLTRAVEAAEKLESRISLTSNAGVHSPEVKKNTFTVS